MLSFIAKDQGKLLNELNAEATEKHDRILVIGAGLPRTGTLSLKTALMQLYNAKCYHMTDVMDGDQEDLDVWMDAIDGKMTSTKWQQYFNNKNYSTGVDFPFSMFYKELMIAFPDAKVVLSTRDPSTWHTSVYNSIFKLTELMNRWSYNLIFKTLDGRKNVGWDFFQKLDSKVHEGCDVGFHDAIKGGPQVAEKFFLDWEKEVRRSVPAERLLVHSAKEGWPPLCQFLELPIPDRPYPRVNDTASIQQATRNFQILHGFIFYLLPLSTAVGSYIFEENITSVFNWGCQIISNIWT